MAKEILVITGSPKKKGNTFQLTDAFIKGAEKAGHTITRFDAGLLTINPCKDCRYCYTHDGVCIQKDDMQPIHEALRRADVLVMASPIYFYSLSAQMRCFTDRMIVAVGKPFNIQSTALLLVSGDEDAAVMEPSILQYEWIYKHLRWHNLGVIKAAGYNDPGDIDGAPALKEAFELGSAIK